MKNSSLIALAFFASACFSHHDTVGCHLSPGDVGEKGHLVFVGEGTRDDPQALFVHPTAVGGTQSIAVQNPTQQPPFHIVSATPTLIAVAGNVGDRATLSALSEGTTSLRAIDDKNGAILDALSVSSRSIHTVDFTTIRQQTTLPLALFRRGSLTVDFALHSATYEDLVDSTFSFQATGAVVSHGPWYHVTVKPSLLSSVSSLTLTPPRGSGSLTMALVDTIDELEVTNPSALTTGIFVGNTQYAICPYVKTGGFEVIGHAPIALDLSGGLVAIPHYSDPECWNVYGIVNGPASITLRIGNTLQKEYPITVVGIGDGGTSGEDLSAVTDLAQHD